MELMHVILAVSLCAAATHAITPAVFDYIIIGGGTCGLTVANRLSEDPDVTVAVIEAGGDERNNLNVTNPDGYGRAFHTPVDWAYKTTPQVHANGQSLEYPSGKALGGSSTINGMTYLRANKEDIDAWETLGNTGWNWDNLYPYYLKSERFQIPTKAQAFAGASFIDEFHGFKGPLKVGYPYNLLNGTFPRLIRETWNHLGFNVNPDTAGGEMLGFSTSSRTLDREANVREDSARAYYQPVEERANLVVFRGLVERIIWEDDMSSDGKAMGRGVQYLGSDGRSKTILATKEIILSAGTIRSSAILELSGVGNPTILSKYNITTIVPLPSVGENAQDQPAIFVVYNLKNVTTKGAEPYITYATIYDLFGRETKNIARITADSLHDWAESVADARGNWVDATAIERLFKVQHDLVFKHRVSCVELLKTGSMSRQDPNYFLIDWDLVLLEQLRESVNQFWSTPPINHLVVQRVEPNVTIVPENASVVEWRSWMKKALRPNLHPIGTASMLPRELGGVVDEKLVVYGTENIRVVDASILPMQVAGHPTATLYAISERAADIIKGLFEL